MVLRMDLFESGLVHVGVNLGGGDIGVAEHFLDESQGSAVGEKMAGETVS